MCHISSVTIQTSDNGQPRQARTSMYHVLQKAPLFLKRQATSLAWEWTRSAFHVTLHAEQSEAAKSWQDQSERT